MDAENRIIPIVEDDQGEGWKDPLDQFNPPKTRAEKKRRKKAYDMRAAQHERRR